MELAVDFVNWLKNQVHDFAGKYTVADHRAFPAWAFTFLFDLDDDQAFNATDTLTQGDAGIDGWYFDTDNSVFHLIQAKYHESPESSVTSPDGLRALIHAALLLRDSSAIATGPHHDKLSEVSLSMQQALDDNFSISLDYIVAGRIGPNVRTEIEIAVRTLGQNYTATFYDTERMQELWVSDEPIGDLSGETGDFLVSGTGEYYEKGKLEVPGVAKSAIVSLDGRSIAELVSKHGARLFQANVRYYLTKTNRVNKEMAKTLESLEGRSAFWLYNNGLTIVADDYEFIETDDGTVLRASNPQIVNGAQTSSVLRDRRAMIEYGDVSVQTRIIATERSDLGRSALTNISEYTNSQSQVRISDLRANDERHKKIQRAFDSLKEPIFYERRRGEWQALDKAAQTKYAKRRMKKEDVGQRYRLFAVSSGIGAGWMRPDVTVECRPTVPGGVD
ncbi:AIPR family protein, partial [Rhodococcus sp. NPDC047139]|uniref:AIPR family protein n=1 Tax=Rhodococcus sp. NPDC047139 TaxID=3155141 RepID=UPI0033E4B968